MANSVRIAADMLAIYRSRGQSDCGARPFQRGYRDPLVHMGLRPQSQRLDVQCQGVDKWRRDLSEAVRFRTRPHFQFGKGTGQRERRGGCRQ